MNAIKYIERVQSGHNGPAWIGLVEFSSSKKTLYFNNRALKSWGGIVGGNYYDLESDDTYWISNPKKKGGDRHKFGGGIIYVQSSILSDYLELRGATELDERFYQVSSGVKETNKSRFHDLENQILTDQSEDDF